MKNKISIIVPIFNSEKYLTRCLASLQNQTLTLIPQHYYKIFFLST